MLPSLMLELVVFFRVCDFHHNSDMSVASGEPLDTETRHIAVLDATVWWQVVLCDNSVEYRVRLRERWR
jgi:hypothetical protein